MRTSAPDAIAVPQCAVAIARTIVNPSPAPAPPWLGSPRPKRSNA